VERFAAFLRAVNVGKRRVAMATAREALTSLGYSDVSSFVNSGNLLFTASGKPAKLQSAIRAALEDEFGFEITTFVRTEAQVKALATEKPFGQLKPGHTHFVLLPLTPLSEAERRAVEAMSDERDEVVVRGGDVHWLIRARSIETSLGPRQWKQALPDNPTTARNTTMIERLAARFEQRLK
jgi:uncharacterized protein (DUF1697 family)